MIGDSSELGGANDRAELVLDGRTVLHMENYEVHQSFFTQPCAFSMKIGSGDQAKTLMALAPPNTDFELRVAGKAQFVGKTDGYSFDGGPNGGSLSIMGRDNMAPLHDSFVRADTTFKSSSFEDLVRKVFTAIPIRGYSLFTDNSANRSKKVGVKVTQTAVPDYLVGVLGDAALSGKASIVAKAGERWLGYLHKEFNLAGLFLFAGVDGTYILTGPNALQQPTYRLVRQANAPRSTVNIETARFKNETVSRYSECVIITRGGSTSTDAKTALAVAGRKQASNKYVDEEMTALGFDRPLVKKSKKATSPAEAQFLARKYIAEANRHNVGLTYTVSGHTAPSLFGNEPAVWSVDTVVDVQDDDLGISGPFWIESVNFRSSPTTTELVLQRPQDLVFGGSDE